MIYYTRVLNCINHDIYDNRHIEKLTCLWFLLRSLHLLISSTFPVLQFKLNIQNNDVIQIIYFFLGIYFENKNASTSRNKICIMNYANFSFFE